MTLISASSEHMSMAFSSSRLAAASRLPPIDPDTSIMNDVLSQVIGCPPKLHPEAILHLLPVFTNMNLRFLVQDGISQARLCKHHLFFLRGEKSTGFARAGRPFWLDVVSGSRLLLLEEKKG